VINSGLDPWWPGQGGSEGALLLDSAMPQYLPQSCEVVCVGPIKRIALSPNWIPVGTLRPKGDRISKYVFCWAQERNVILQISSGGGTSESAAAQALIRVANVAEIGKELPAEYIKELTPAFGNVIGDNQFSNTDLWRLPCFDLASARLVILNRWKVFQIRGSTFDQGAGDLAWQRQKLWDYHVLLVPYGHSTLQVCEIALLSRSGALGRKVLDEFEDCLQSIVWT